MKSYKGGRVTPPFTLNRLAGFGLVISSTLLPLYRRERIPISIQRELGGLSQCSNLHCSCRRTVWYPGLTESVACEIASLQNDDNKDYDYDDGDDDDSNNNNNKSSYFLFFLLHFLILLIILILLLLL
jgi:hypothetical protein